MFNNCRLPRVGMRVHDMQDERFIGTVVAVINSAYCIVKWDDMNWRTWVPVERVKIAEE